MQNQDQDFFRDFKGIWIPKEIWFDNQISLPVEKFLFSEIHSLDGPNGCFASNKYFSKLLGISENMVTRYISKLKNLKYIRQESFNGRKRVLRSNLKFGFQNR